MYEQIEIGNQSTSDDVIRVLRGCNGLIYRYFVYVLHIIIDVLSCEIGVG